MTESTTEALGPIIHRRPREWAPGWPVAITIVFLGLTIIVQSFTLRNLQRQVDTLSRAVQQLQRLELGRQGAEYERLQDATVWRGRL